MKNKQWIVILILVMVVSAATFAIVQGTRSPQVPPPVTETTAPTITPGYQPCAYVWAYQDLPEISADLQAQVQAIQPDATARASAFGENCVAADGSSTFGAMETDFYVTIPVADLTDAESLGNLIEQVLTVVDQFARPLVPGPNDGFVEFTFTAGSEQRILRVAIPLGRDLRAQGLRGAELFRALENN